MNIKSKKILIAAVILSGLLIVVAIYNVFFGLKTGKITTPRRPEISVSSPPRSIDFPKIPIGASFTYEGPKKTLPGELLTYTYREDLSPMALNRIADSVTSGFHLESTASATIDGSSFIYTRNDAYKSASLSKTKDIISISYQRILVEDDTMLLPEGGVAAFFTSLLAPSREMSLSSLPSENSSIEGVVILERPFPNLKSYATGMSVGGVTLLTKEYTQRWASVIVDDKNAIRILNYIAPPKLAPGAPIQVISLDQAIANLNNKRGEILWITQSQGDPYGVVPSFNKGTLTDFILVYVFKEGRLVPAYLFDGKGVSSDGSTQVYGALVLASPETSR